jgi:hypothetical protein
VSPIASRILLYFVPPLAFSVLYAVVILVAWRRRVKPDKSVEQLIEAYRNPINTGITVSGFVFPLLGAVIGYVVTKDGNEPRYLAGLVASSLLLVGAISAGLFLAYSFATTATSDKFKIDEKHNLIVPATLVFHFALLVSALVVSLVAFAVDGERMLRPHDAAVALNTAPSAFSITRNNISLGSSRNSQHYHNVDILLTNMPLRAEVQRRSAHRIHATGRREGAMRPVLEEHRDEIEQALGSYENMQDVEVMLDELIRVRSAIQHQEQGYRDEEMLLSLLCMITYPGKPPSYTAPATMFRRSLMGIRYDSGKRDWFRGVVFDALISASGDEIDFDRVAEVLMRAVSMSMSRQAAEVY